MFIGRLTSSNFIPSSSSFFIACRDFVSTSLSTPLSKASLIIPIFIFLAFDSSRLEYSSAGLSNEVLSFKSCPEITSEKSAASWQVFPIGTILSSEFPKSINPYLETRPYVGHNPKTPQNDAGSAIEPPVLSLNAICGKSAFLVRPAAPPDEPPQLLSLSTGFFGILNPLPTFTEKLPNPNSS